MKVLVIDDSELICQMISMVLGQAGFQVQTAFSMQEAISLLCDQNFDGVVTDLHLPDVKNTDPVSPIRQATHADLPVVILSGRPQQELDRRALELGATAAISKDLGVPHIAATLPGLLRR